MLERRGASPRWQSRSMARQISVSAPPPPAGEGSSSDLGSWLARDLRVKGSPISSRPPAPSAEEVERAALAGWLSRDLKPKHSLRPSRVPPEPSSIAPAPAAPPEPNGSPAPKAVLAPKDSLAPQVLPPEARPSATPAARDLDDDDLAVLPGRRRKAKAGATRRRVALALGAALLVGTLALGWRARGPAANFEGAANAAALDTAAALPPPPPDERAPAEAEPAPAATRAVGRGTASLEEEPGLDDPRSFLDGLAVRRYADVPTRTLSRLAREQRERARARDDAVRATGAASGAPTSPAEAAATARPGASASASSTATSSKARN